MSSPTTISINFSERNPTYYIIFEIREKNGKTTALKRFGEKVPYS